jgi:hypothetical protein
MKPHVRAAVAYVAGRVISGEQFSSIYDYAERRYRTIDGSVDVRSVNVYDYEQRKYFGGSGGNGSYSLYHYGDRHYDDLKVSGSEFEGYDYGSRKYFSGRVNGSTSISVYDYEFGRYFEYSR